MFVAVASKSAWHAVGEQIASLLTFINKTYSETGQVKLASRDWRLSFSSPLTDASTAVKICFPMFTGEG